MEDFSQSEIMVQLRSSMKVLDSLRSEHKAALEELIKGGETNGQPKPPKVESLESFIDKIERAIGDGDVCTCVLVSHFCRSSLPSLTISKFLKPRNRG